MRFQTSALAAIASLVLSAEARWHYSCTCHNGGSYIWQLTETACAAYNKYIFQTWPDSQNSVRYDSVSGRCTSVGPGGNVIDGDTIKRICWQTAETGFPCDYDSSATCVADPNSVTSYCD